MVARGRPRQWQAPPGGYGIRPYGVGAGHARPGTFPVNERPRMAAGGACPAPTSPLKLKLHLFRQVCRGRIYASRAVYPLYRMIGTAAAGGIYAAPTSQPILFILVYSRGRGMPRPYSLPPSPSCEGAFLLCHSIVYTIFVGLPQKRKKTFFL